MATPEQAAEVESHLRKWQDVMQLGSWMIDVVHRDESHDTDSEIKATMNSRYRYFEATLTIYPPFWTKPADWRERAIMHELAHTLLEEQADLANAEFITQRHREDVNEKTTELVSRVAWFARIRGKEEVSS